MNAQEKRVIRWKRDLLAANLTFNDETVKQLQARGLLWDSVLEQCESETANCGKVWKFLEHLMRVNVERNVFQAFLAYLDEDHPWISTELKVELELEKGDLKIDEYIRNEASKLVHRQFGTTKRFSEQEKKAIEDLIAVRSQCTKNIWIRNVEETRKILDDHVAVNSQRDELIVRLCGKIQDSLRANKSAIATSRGISTERLPELARDNASGDGKEEKVSGRSLLTKLDSLVDKLIEAFKICSDNLDDLKEEQSRGFQLLSATEPNVAVDKGAYMTMQRIADKIREYRQRSDEDGQTIASLRDEADRMKIEFNEESSERDRAIRYLTLCLEKSETRSQQVEEELYNARNNLKKNTDELMSLDQKNQMLEKQRHYAFWFDRHGPQADEPTSERRSVSLKKRTGRKSVKKNGVNSSSVAISPATSIL